MRDEILYSDQQPAGAALRVAQVGCHAPDAIDQLARQLGPSPFALICLFVSAQADFDRLVAQAQGVWETTQVISCTTAGEIGGHGYEDGQIIAVAFPKRSFCIEVHRIDDLAKFDPQREIDALILRRLSLNARAAHMPHEFAFLVMDGLSMKEERLTSILPSALGPMAVFGGSAGDGTDFESIKIAFDGVVSSRGACVALIRSHCRAEVFSHDNLVPSQERMVVTSASPQERIVHEINGEPAGREYARLLNKDPQHLSQFTFAAHPVAVRVGERHHVRSIQSMYDNGDLQFFSAIDEGMVLSLTDSLDVTQELDARLSALGAPEYIIGCDCLLRRLEIEQLQKIGAVSDVLRKHNVFGFSTYGEQIGCLHVNQTFTGVAIYAPSV